MWIKHQHKCGFRFLCLQLSIFALVLLSIKKCLLESKGATSGPDKSQNGCLVEFCGVALRLYARVDRRVDTVTACVDANAHLCEICP